nr:hypothetical protein [Fusobacterium sp.]
MVNKNLMEVEKWIKSNLKKKVSVTQATVITFLMTGTFMSTPLFAADISNEQNTLELEQIESEKAEAKRIKEKAEALKKLIASGELNREMFSGMGAGERASAPNKTITTYSGQDRAAGQTRARATGAIVGDAMGGFQEWYVVGNNDKNYGKDSVTLGVEALASAEKAVAIGKKAEAKSFQSLAIGSESNAVSRRSIVVGSGSYGEGDNSLVLGNESIVSSVNAIAIGTESGAIGSDSIAIGTKSHVNKKNGAEGSANSIAIGTEATVSNDNTMALGTRANVTRENSMALGASASVTRENSIALGKSSSVIREDSIAIGANSSVKSHLSIAIGSGANIDKNMKGSTAIGNDVKIRGSQGTSVGYQMYSGKQATSIGNDSIAYGLASIAIGSDDIAEDKDGNTVYIDQLSEATKNKIFGTDGNFKLGDAMTEAQFKGKFWGADNKQYSPTLAYAPGAITIGARSIAYGKGSTSMGTLAFALGENSTAMGFRSFADEDGGIAVGEEARSFAENGLAVGNHSESSGAKSSAYGNYARAVGDGALAIGDNVVANGMVSNWRDFKDIVKNNSNGIPNLDNALNQINTSKGQKGNYFNYVEGGKSYIEIGNKSIKKTRKVKDHAVSLGHLVLSTGKGAVGIGTATFVDGDNSIGLGSLALVDTGAHNSVAMGTGANVLKQNSMALGVGTKATLEKSVALGYKSRTDYNENLLNANAYSLKDDAFTIDAGNNIGVVSVGASDFQRRIVNLAPGREDTDAVNVAQLKGVKDYINQRTSLVPKNLTLVADQNGSHEYNTKVAKTINLHTDDGWGVGDDRFVGDNIETFKTNDSILFGIKQRPTFGKIKLNPDRNGHNLDPNSTNIITLTPTHTGVNFGDKKLEGVAPGTVDTDGVNVSQLKTKANKNGDNLSADDITAWKNLIDTDTDTTLHYVSVNSTGTPNKDNRGATGNNAIAIGQGSTAPKNDSLAIGNTASANSEASTAIGHLAKVEEGPQDNPSVYDGAVALGQASLANRAKGSKGWDITTNAASTATDRTWQATRAAVSVGSNSKDPVLNRTRQIINVAAGTQDTDAVNVAQLKKTREYIDNALPMFWAANTSNKDSAWNYGGDLGITQRDVRLDFGYGIKATKKTHDGKEIVLVELDKDSIKNDPEFKGPKGDKGEAGQDGAQGPAGPQGPKGEAGQDGAQGPAGPQGPKGEAGQDGAQGPAGPQGPKGEAGQDGAQGPVGPQGPKGEAGQDGAPGAKGEKGDKGDQGETGPAGPKGEPGTPGRDGVDGKDGVAGIGGSLEEGPFEYIKEDGETKQKLVKINGKYYPAPAKDGEHYVVSKSGKVYPENTELDPHTGELPEGTDTTTKPSPVTEVSVSDEELKIQAKGQNAKLVKNIASNLPGAEGVASNPAVTEVSRTAPTNLNDIKNNVATVSDVLNAGWNLEGNGTGVDFVKAYDTVNFVDGDGTTARVTTDVNNKVNKVTFDIAVDNNTTKLVGTKDNVNYVKLADGSWKEYDAATGEASKDPNAKTIAKVDGNLVEDVKVVAVQTPATAASTETVKAGDGVSLELEGVAGAAGTKYTVKAKVDDKTLEIDPNTKAIKAKTIALTPNTTDGTVSVPEANKENLVTAKAVADAINNSGFKVKANDGAEELVKTGETVTFKDGQNISITRDGKVFTVATKADLLANSVGKKAGAKATFGENSITLSKGTEPVELAGVKSVIPEATTEKDFATQLEETAKTKPNNGVNVSDLNKVVTIAKEKSVETVLADAKAQAVGLTVSETTDPASDIDKEWTVSLDKDELAKAMVADPTAPDTENKAKTALEEGLDLTYKANGANGKTTSLKDGLDFTNGTNTVASVGDNGEVKFDLKKNIDLSTPATTQGGAPTYGSITGLTHNITPVVSPTTQKVDTPTISDADKHKAATVGDVLNTGWNLSAKNGDTETFKDFVNPYDEVVFADGTGTTVNVESDGTKSTIKYDVKVDNATIKTKQDGTLYADIDVPTVNN